MEADDRIYGLTVSGEGLVAYVDPAFRVGVDEADIVIEEHGGSPRMKLTTDRILGDVNNDGQVDAFDALYVLLYSEDSSITLPNNGDISLGDVNGDGQVDLADAVLLATYSVNPSDPALPPGIGQAAPDLESSVSGTSVGESTFSHIYWTDVNSRSSKIQRANLDGSNIETLFTIESKISYPTLDIDMDRGKIYWKDYDAKDRHKIRRANLDGSNIETLFITKNGISNLTLDANGGKIYWTDDIYYYWSDGRYNSGAVDVRGGKIRRANLDGSNIETLVLIEDEDKNDITIYDIVLDSARGKIYWTYQKDFKRAFQEHKIQRANLDGSNIETLVTELDKPPRDLALDVDRGKIYWTEIDVFDRTWRSEIQRANLDGSNIETLPIPNLSANGLHILSIVLDLTGGKIYWRDRGKIQRANLDGSNIETLLTGLTFTLGLGDQGFFALGGFYEPANTEETRTRSPEEARSELAERGVPYSQRSFITYAQNGDLDVVRLFVEAGMDVNVQPYSSSVANIAETTEQGDLVAVWFPQPGDEDDDTALMKAAGQGHIEVVRFLVEQGADFNIRNRQEQDALMLAAAGGHLAVATFLIDNGAPIRPLHQLLSTIITATAPKLPWSGRPITAIWTWSASC